MSESVATAGHASAGKPAMSVFERFLTFWVALCIIVGIALGQLLPGVFHVIGDATVAQVNLPVAVLVWLMIVPMLLKIDLAALREVGQHWRGIATTRGGSFSLDRGLQFLRARRGDCYRAVRLSIGRRTRDRGWRARGSAGHALRRAHRSPLARLV